MRDTQHYLSMLRRNPNAAIGHALAAAAVYASRHGTCEPPHHSTSEYRDIVRDLKARYVEPMTATEVRREMGITPRSNPHNDHARKHAKPARATYSGDESAIAQIKAIGEGSFTRGVDVMREKYG